MPRECIVAVGVRNADVAGYSRLTGADEDATHRTLSDYLGTAKLTAQPTRVRERGMRRFKSRVQAQRFLDVHAAVYNLFNLGRHLTSARHYRELRHNAFASWEKAVAA